MIGNSESKHLGAQDTFGNMRSHLHDIAIPNIVWYILQDLGVEFKPYVA